MQKAVGSGRMHRLNLGGELPAQLRQHIGVQAAQIDGLLRSQIVCLRQPPTSRNDVEVVSDQAHGLRGAGPQMHRGKPCGTGTLAVCRSVIEEACGPPRKQIEVGPIRLVRPSIAAHRTHDVEEGGLQTERVEHSADEVQRRVGGQPPAHPARARQLNQLPAQERVRPQRREVDIPVGSRIESFDGGGPLQVSLRNQSQDRASMAVVQPLRCAQLQAQSLRSNLQPVDNLPRNAGIRVDDAVHVKDDVVSIDGHGPRMRSQNRIGMSVVKADPKQRRHIRRRQRRAATVRVDDQLPSDVVPDRTTQVLL
mmetsp:Transcript_108629/g.350656  ORF Transcript_108629/g.350656 Transcript_108629/m.350656 type:complete len:309 (+) Transcript_108629:1834-2760(+)